MLVNNSIDCKEETNHVEFVSYTGDWPNTCSGVLTLKIDGKEYKFGHKKYKDDNYDQFWQSGGYIDLYSDEMVHVREWRVNVCCIPKEFRKYATEIDYVFNQNVPWGCCGGCI